MFTSVLCLVCNYILHDGLHIVYFFSVALVIIIYHAYKVKGGVGEVDKLNNINIVYTKEAETADSYIEKVTKKLAKNNRVKVVTSDGLEQLIIMGNGCLRVSSQEFYQEVKEAENNIREIISKTF